MLRLLGDASDPSHRVRVQDDRALSVDYFLHLPDGTELPFALTITVDEQGAVRVGEREEHRRLPAGCPERHINGDGSFCLGLRGVDDVSVVDANAAARWWARLAGFLRMQALADRTRRWPEGRGWAHGQAAESQRRLEELAHGKPWLLGASQATAAEDETGAACPCGGGQSVEDCHAAELREARELQTVMRDQERAFSSAWSQPCCETMETCGIRDAAMSRSTT